MKGNELNLKPVVAPGLGQPGYGRNMAEVFKNIEDNFKIVGNHEFIKGDKGYSVKSMRIPLVVVDPEHPGDSNSSFITTDGQAFLNAVFALNQVVIDWNNITGGVSRSVHKWEVINWLNRSGYASVHSLSDGTHILNAFNEDAVYNVFAIYNPTDDNEPVEIVGAANDIVFKDARFVQSWVSRESDRQQYSSLFDFTCTVHLNPTFDENNQIVSYFDVLQNFPSLYYDGTTGYFCWKVFGQPTGIIAQGPQGKAGQNATLWIVEIEATAMDTTSEVSHDDAYHKILRWIDPSTGHWNDPKTDSNPAFKSGDSCIAFTQTRDPKSNSEESQGLDIPPYPLAFAGTIRSYSEGYGVYVDKTRGITSLTGDYAVRSAMSRIGWDDNSILKGVFVPFQPDMKASKGSILERPVHMLWAAPSGRNDNMDVELHLTPFAKYRYTGLVASALASKQPPQSEAESNTRLSYLGKVGTSRPNDVDKGEQVTQNDALMYIDYPQVIISGHKDGNHVSSLGIGTTYLEPLVDKRSTSATPVYMDIPRIKVGTGGIVQIGADDSSSSANNKGSLVVSNIYSSMTGMTKSSDGGCPLNLMSTDGRINLIGSHVELGSPSHISDGLITVNGKLLAQNDVDIDGDVNVIGQMKITSEDDTHNSISVIPTQSKIRLQGKSQIPRIDLAYYEDEDDAYNAASISFDGTDLCIASDYRIICSADYLKFGSHLLVPDTLGARGDSSTCRSIISTIRNIWTDGESGGTENIYVKLPTLSTGSYKLIKGDGTKWSDSGLKSGTLEFDGGSTKIQKTGSISHKGNHKIKLVISTKRNYASDTFWVGYIDTITRTTDVTLIAQIGSTEYTLAYGSVLKTYDTNTQGNDYTIPWMGKHFSDYEKGIAWTRHTITLTTNKFDVNVTQGQTIKLKYRFKFVDKFSGSNCAACYGNSSSEEKYRWRYQVDSVSYPSSSSSVLFTNTEPTVDNTYVPKMRQYHNVLMLGVSQHRNIGLYVTGDNYDEVDENNQSGIFVTFNGVAFSGSDKNNGVCFIPMSKIYEAITGKVITAAFTDTKHPNTSDNWNQNTRIQPLTIYKI